MTERRESDAEELGREAASAHEIVELYAQDASLHDFVVAGGFRRFSPSRMFEVVNQ